MALFFSFAKPSPNLHYVAQTFQSKVAGKAGVKTVDAGSVMATGTQEISPEKRMENAVVAYTKLFETLRKEQTGYAEKIFSKARYSDRYKMTKVLLDECFSMLRGAQRNISEIDLGTLPSFPLYNQSILHDLTVVWEKTALLGDLTLRLPDMVHQQVDNHKVRMEVAEWAISVCEVAPLFAESVHGTQLGFVRQELSIATEVDPNYANPFSDASLKEQKAEHDRVQKRKRKVADKLEKKETRGPKLSILRSEL